MITILISGPQGVGKTAIAMAFTKAMRHFGFVSFRIYTTNSQVEVPEDATREDE